MKRQNKSEALNIHVNWGRILADDSLDRDVLREDFNHLTDVDVRGIHALGSTYRTDIQTIQGVL